MLNFRVVASVVSVGMMVLRAADAFGQDYPSQPIRIVTATAGGGSDFVSRQIAQGITGSLGQPVIVENRGSGVVQGEFLLKAPPDGYGLVVAGSSFWIGPLIQTLPYDVARDFSPISLLAREVNVLVVNPSLPVKAVAELIALAKARPGETGTPGRTTRTLGEVATSVTGAKSFTGS